ncbi:hypothetical protein IF1G_00307 [Cordyceps javanica]|uniref:Uncharacterized protein n=1 Tax=Cordyceps javanica TaxID=43265 RepID=A0A545WC54_9HYPO|nr:hypothetical protein IF1G_00307 [Cordyceps javanica]TQW11564.1 hypothetical protein IF2G_00295 [Cordyceps javanica]
MLKSLTPPTAIVSPLYTADRSLRRPLATTTTATTTTTRRNVAARSIFPPPTFKNTLGRTLAPASRTTSPTVQGIPDSMACTR